MFEVKKEDDNVDGCLVGICENGLEILKLVPYKLDDEDKTKFMNEVEKIEYGNEVSFEFWEAGKPNSCYIIKKNKE